MKKSIQVDECNEGAMRELEGDRESYPYLIHGTNNATDEKKMTYLPKLMYLFYSSRSRHSSGAKSRDSSSGSEIGSRKRKKVRSGSSGDESPKELAIHEDGDDDEKNATEGAENVGRGDIFGDDLSISSDEDESSKEEKRRVIEDDDDDDDNKSVQRYGDDDEDMEKDPEDGDEKGEKEKMQIPVEEEEPVSLRKYEPALVLQTKMIFKYFA